MKLSPGFRRLLPLLACLCGLTGLVKVTGSYAQETLHQKDFISPYLMTQAILDSASPYQPLPILAQTYLNISDYQTFPHPTPHTPIMALLCLPFGLLSFKSAALVWLVFEIVCLWLAIRLLIRHWLGTNGKRWTSILCGMILVWSPIASELWWGQINTLFLLLLTVTLLELQRGHDARAGALLGFILAVKLFAWPIVFFLALRRRWKAVLMAGAIVIAANLVSVAALGLDCVKDYYLNIGPSVSAHYRTGDLNMSAWAWPFRFLSEHGTFFRAPAFWDSPMGAKVSSFILSLVVLFAGIRLALRSRSFDHAFCILLITSILVSPVAWYHYLTITILPLVVITQRLYTLEWPRDLMRWALSVFVLLSVPQSAVIDLVKLLQTGQTPDGLPMISASASLITLIPSVGVCGLGWCLWLADKGVFINQKKKDNYLTAISQNSASA